MSNSARFIILGSEHGCGQSAGTCSVQIGCGVADRLYLAPGRSLPSRAGLQRGPLPQGWQGRLSPFSNTDLGFLVKTEPWLLQAPEAAGHQLCAALRGGSGVLFVCQEAVLVGRLRGRGLSERFVWRVLFTPVRS